MGYRGMCRCEGYGFQAVYSGRTLGLEQGIVLQGTGFQSRLGKPGIATQICNKIKSVLFLLLQDEWGGRGGALEEFSRIGQQNSAKLALNYNLGQNKWKTQTPPPPKPRMGKWHGSSRGFILDLVGWGGGDGGLLFHFILSKIVALVQVKGSRVPAIHPHPKIPIVPHRGQGLKGKPPLSDPHTHGRVIGMTQTLQECVA